MKEIQEAITALEAALAKELGHEWNSHHVTVSKLQAAVIWAKEAQKAKQQATNGAVVRLVR